MGSRPDGWWKDRDRALHRLIDEIVRWTEAGDVSVTVVADGTPGRVPEGRTYGIEVRYAHSRRRDAADDLIISILEAEQDPTAATVVSSDRRLQERARRLGAAGVGSRSFLEVIADVDARRSDRRVLAEFGIDEESLMGRGSEARVFPIDDERVLRLPHPGVPAGALDERRRLLDAIFKPGSIRTPRVIEHAEVDRRTVVVEERLPGQNALDVLGQTDERTEDRAALVRAHLEAANRIADLRLPAAPFGELMRTGFSLHAPTFSGWSQLRLTDALDRAPAAFSHLDADRLTGDVVRALRGVGLEPDAGPVVVHLDAFLGNMLAEGSRITGVIDFGATAIAGPRGLDPLICIAYLGPEVTPTATDHDREVARRWAAERGWAAAVGPVERWVGAYWCAIVDDEALHRWCRRVLEAE